MIREKVINKIESYLLKTYGNKPTEKEIHKVVQDAILFFPHKHAVPFWKQFLSEKRLKDNKIDIILEETLKGDIQWK